MSIVNEFLNNLNISETIVALVIGVILLVFGYRIKRMAFFVIWFMLGYILMNNYIMDFINSNAPEIVSSDLYQMLLPIAGGLLLALLGFSIEKICIGGICFALTMIITSTYFGTDMQTLAIGAIIGVIVSGAGVILMKPTVIVATAFAGAYTVAISVLKISNLDPTVYYFPILIGSAAVGTIIQFLTTRNIN